jgi:hypothetical protein
MRRIYSLQVCSSSELTKYLYLCLEHKIFIEMNIFHLDVVQ